MKLFSVTLATANCHKNGNTHPFNGPFLGLPRWAGTRKVKPIWILLKQETVSGSGISWAICKSAPRSRQITTPGPHHSSFFTGRMPFLPPDQPCQSSEGTTRTANSTRNIITGITNKYQLSQMNPCDARPHAHCALETGTSVSTINWPRSSVKRCKYCQLNSRSDDGSVYHTQRSLD